MCVECFMLSVMVDFVYVLVCLLDFILLACDGVELNLD